MAPSPNAGLVPAFFSTALSLRGYGNFLRRATYARTLLAYDAKARCEPRSTPFKEFPK